MQRVHRIRDEYFADDVAVTDEMRSWTDGELEQFFASGGETKPAKRGSLHLSTEQIREIRIKSPRKRKSVRDSPARSPMDAVADGAAAAWAATSTATMDAIAKASVSTGDALVKAGANTTKFFEDATQNAGSVISKQLKFDSEPEAAAKSKAPMSPVYVEAKVVEQQPPLVALFTAMCAGCCLPVQ